MVYTVDEIRDKIIPIAEKYNLSKVYLFGSYARGEADDDSDVDLAYDGFDYDKYPYSVLQTEIENTFGDDVDFLDVEMILSPQTHVGQLLKKYFLQERVSLYEKG